MFKLLLALLKTNSVAEEVLKRGGDDTIATIHGNMYDDKEIRLIGRLLIDKIASKGSKVGREWIQKLKQHLLYGVPLTALQDILSAADETKSSAKIFPINGDGADRGEDSSGGTIKKLICIMDKYAEVESLQLDGTEVFIQLAGEKQTGVPGIVRCNGLVTIISAMAAHKKSDELLWRCCALISELGSELYVCIELARCGICPVLMSMFELSTHGNPCRPTEEAASSSDVRQHALFAISTLCREKSEC